MNSMESQVTGAAADPARRAVPAELQGAAPHAGQEPKRPEQSAEEMTPAKAKRLLLLAVSVLAWSRFPLLRWPFIREAAWTLLRDVRIRRPVSSLLQFVRTRKWLSGALTVCSAILALIVAFEQDPAAEGEFPADGTTIVFDDVKSHDELSLDSLSGQVSSSVRSVFDFAGLQETAEPENSGPAESSGEFQLVANQTGAGTSGSFNAPAPHYGSPTPTAVRGAWLTGAIELIPDGNAPSRVAEVDPFSPQRN